MIKLYNEFSNDFNNNGIGILKDTYNAEVTEYLNGEFSLYLEYPINGKYAKSITNRNIIKCDAGLEEEQLFRIKRVVPTLTTLKVTAYHITYDLADNILEDAYPQNLDGQAFLDHILSRTQYKHRFIGFSNISNTATARYVRKNPIETLIGDVDNSFVKILGGELLRNNFKISMLNRRGSETGYKIKYRKNLTGLEITEDDSELATRLMPKGYDGLLLPEIYIDSPLINMYSHPYIKILECEDIKVKTDSSDDDGYNTKEEAYGAMREACKNAYEKKNVDKTSINVKVDFIDLKNTTAYKKYSYLQNLSLGDTATLIRKVGKELLSYNLRIIKTVYNVNLKRFTNLELGEYKNNYVIKTESSISGFKEEVSNVMLSSLEKAKQNATEQITAALGGYIYKTQNELFIMDTNNPNTASKVWRWNLNGLGYSKNGINGPYELAMTQDGKIVADFITTGILDASLIKSGLIKSNNFKDNVSGTSISLTNGEIITAKFKVYSDGTIKAIGGDIGGFSLSEKNFSSNFNGIYNYNDYDLRLTTAMAIGWISKNKDLLNILDANNDGVLNSADFLKIKKILLGIDTNTRKLSGKLIINSEDPKNNIAIYKGEDLILSLGIGGINTNAVTTEIIICGVMDGDNFKGIIIDGESCTIRFIDENEEIIKISSNSFKISGTIDANVFKSKNTYDNDTVSNATNLYITSNGNIRRTTNTSSKRYKKDIKKITDESLNPEKLYNLEVKQFKYKDKYQPNENDPRYNKNLLGFIAEDMAELYPIAVDYEIDENGNKIIENWNERYIIPAMLKLIQEQHKEIEKLKESGENK